MDKPASTFKCPPGYKILIPVPLESQGMSCSICKCLSPYAAPNQPDGSFICYICRVDCYYD